MSFCQGTKHNSYSIVAMKTDLRCHLNYNSGGAWYTALLSHYKWDAYEFLHSEKNDFLKSIINYPVIFCYTCIALSDASQSIGLNSSSGSYQLAPKFIPTFPEEVDNLVYDLFCPNIVK